MMNKDEAVKKLATVGHLSMAHAEDLYDSIVPKPVVKQCVADWYEEIKGEFYLNLHYLAWDMFENLDEDACVPKKALEDDFTRWYRKNENAIQTLVNMHQFGYTVEKEPRYTVRIKATNQYLCNDGIGPHFSPGFRTDFTKTDLEKSGFGWVFDCEGVEVKEVDDGND